MRKTEAHPLGVKDRDIQRTQVREQRQHQYQGFAAERGRARMALARHPGDRLGRRVVGAQSDGPRQQVERRGQHQRRYQ
ncbi:MAG: hypothetical protein R3E68_11320 [Burkholderiaceae bacterium]